MTFAQIRMKYLIAPRGWSHEDPNPFTPDGRYGAEWSCFCISGTYERLNFCGSGKNLLFTFCLGREAEHLRARFADFLRYENEHGRNVILSFPEGMETESFVQEALSETSDENAVRQDDPKWVVHSTNLEAWKGIQRDGALKSLSVLMKEDKNVLSVGFNQLGEPSEYAEYIVLGRIDNINAEHVVASQKKGCVFTEADTPYEPGIRLYFDNHKIIESGLAVRDGLYTTKVHFRLPLNPFLVTTVSQRDVDPKGKVREWTPKKFWKAANREFWKQIGE